MSTSKTSEELREKLNELVFKYAGGIRGDYVEADELLGLFEEYASIAIAEARKEELSHIEGEEGKYWWGEKSSERDIAMTIEERIAELTPKPNKSKEDKLRE